MDLSSIDISAIRKVVTRMMDEDHNQVEPVEEHAVDTHAAAPDVATDGSQSAGVDAIPETADNSGETDDRQREARSSEHEDLPGSHETVADGNNDSSQAGDEDLSKQDKAVHDLTQEADSELAGELLHVEKDASNEVASNQDDTDKSSTDAESSKETTEQLRDPDDNISELIQNTNQTNQQDDATNDQLNTTNAKSSVNTTNTTQTEDDDDEPSQKILVDYASKVSGGQILEKSPSLKGTSNLLTGDIDRYAIAPCEEKKYVVVGLSEDILVKIIKLANYERYSSHVKEFQVLASQEYPASHDQWTDLGTYMALSKSGEQTFELKEHAWARYLKFKFLSHYGVEHYCTVSQIKVHGSTMLQGFHEQWIESEKMDRDAGEDEGTEEGEDDASGEEQTEEIDEVETEQNVDSLNEGASTDLAAGTAIEENPDAPPSSVIEMDFPAADDDNGVGEDASDSLEAEKVAKVDAQAHDMDHEADEEENSSTRSDNTAADVAESSIDVHNADTPTTSEASNEAISVDKDVEQIDTPIEEKSAADELNKDSNAIDGTNSDQKENTAPDETAADVSESPKVSKPVGEKNTSSHGMADVVKAAVSEATDEIKKMIRTTIAVIEEDGRTEHDILDDTNYTIDGANGVNESTEQIETYNKLVDHLQANSEDADSLNESKASNGSSLGEDKANGTGVLLNTTIKDADNLTHKNNTVKNSENTTEMGMRKSGSNAAKADMPKEQTASTTTMKVEPTATHPKKRDTINAASSDQIAKFLSRYPSASCIKGLDFQTFKTKAVLPHTTPGAAVGGGAKMEPIFQKITSEIKSVQTTQHQYEQFISAIKTCYEKVLADMANDIDTMQSKFDTRLTLLEMLLLERSDIRPPSQTLLTAPLSAIMAFLPFPMIFNSSEGVFMCLAILVFFVLMRRMKRTKHAIDRVIATNHHAQESKLVRATDSTPEIIAEKESDTDDICSPLPIHNTMRNGFHSSNLPTDISHDVSCEVSVDSSQPSLSRSEPIGTSSELNTPQSSSSSRKNFQRHRFRMKRRARSEGTKTP